MKASVVIPLLQGGLYIRDCLQSLQQQSEQPAIIVVNNGSSDDGPDIVRREFPDVTLLDFARPLGFAGAVNAGIQAALTTVEPPDVVIALNQDTVVDPGWLAAIMSAFVDPAVGLAGCLARFPDGQIQHAGGTLIEPLWYGRNRHSIDDPAPIHYLAALALGMRVTMLDQIGLFDEGFFPAYYEDVDLCLRALAQGWRIELVPAATLIHHEGALQQTSPRHTYMLERQRCACS